MIIGLTGVAGSGKDTAGKILVEQHGYERLAFADIMRDALRTIDPNVIAPHGVPLPYGIACAVYGEDHVKRALGGRRLLENIGDALKALGGNNVIIDATFRKMQPGVNYVVTDVRFNNEADAIRAAGGKILVIERRNNPHATTSTHRSATEHPGGWIVRNDGTLDDLARLLRRELRFLGAPLDGVPS